MKQIDTKMYNIKGWYQIVIEAYRINNKGKSYGVFNKVVYFHLPKWDIV